MATERKQILPRLDPDAHDALARWAGDELRSTNAQIEFLLLAHAASKWVFASLYTQPLEAAAIRALIQHRLTLPGAPQMLLQLGLARTSRSTARRPPAELTDP